MKHKRWPQKWCLLVLIVLLGGMSACSKDESAVDPEKRQRVTKIGVHNSSLKQEENKMEIERKDGGIGETIKLTGQELTVLKVESSKGNENDKPFPGRYFSIVTVQLKNTGTEMIPYKYYFFDAVDDKGKTLQLSITTVDADTALLAGELEPGESVTGTLAFELPRRDKLVTLRYFGNSGASADVSLQ